nr:MAG TPA: hypothetical protein [Caudoviricetes sp.]
MERLTKRDTDGQAMMDCEKCKADWTGKHGKPMVDCTALYCRNRLLGRLVEYEDTELTPEEIDMDHEAAEYLRHLCRGYDLGRLEELVKADKDGRLVVLPCKVGDTVYRIVRDADPHITRDEVRNMYFADDMTLCVELVGGRIILPEKFGKTVFLTREAAEAALEAMKDV